MQEDRILRLLRNEHGLHVEFVRTTDGPAYVLLAPNGIELGTFDADTTGLRLMMEEAVYYQRERALQENRTRPLS